MNTNDSTPPADVAATEKWLQEKLNEAEQSLRSRQQMERTLRSGTDASWALAAKLHPSTANNPPFTKEQRIKAAEGQKRISVKCLRDVEMYRRVLALVRELSQAQSELAAAREEIVDVLKKNESQFAMLQSTCETLKLAYARGHYCDHQPCPGCEAGRSLELITGRPWTQEECESSPLAVQSELAAAKDRIRELEGKV